jgi:hypothetical protein
LLIRNSNIKIKRKEGEKMEMNDPIRIEEEFEALLEANMDYLDVVLPTPRILVFMDEDSFVINSQMTFEQEGNTLKILIAGKEVAELIYFKKGKEEYLRLVEKSEIPQIYKYCFAIFHVSYNSFPIELLKMEMLGELSELLMTAISQFGTKSLEELYLEDFEELVNKWLSVPGIYDRVQKIFAFAEERDIYGTLLGFVINEIVKGYFQESLLKL